MNFSGAYLLEHLVKEGSLRRDNFSSDQITARLQKARRDISSAERSARREDDLDWAYTQAYEAMHKAASAVLMHHGYRTEAKDHRKVTVDVARVLLHNELRPSLDLMDVMRRRRNVDMYEDAPPASWREVQNAIPAAKSFVEAISKLLGL